MFLDVTDEKWVKDELDRFVLAKLEDKNLGKKLGTLDPPRFPLWGLRVLSSAFFGLPTIVDGYLFQLRRLY